MSRTTRVLTVPVAFALAVGLAACSSGSSGSSGSGSTRATDVSTGASTSAGATTSTDATTAPADDPTTDYADLLIDASDIPVPGFEKGEPQDPPQGTGTTVAFTGEGGRVLGDTILVLDTPDAAAAAAVAAVDAARGSVTGAEVSDAPIGDGGTAVRGTNASGAVTVLVFSLGRAFAVLEFDSPAADPVPTDVVQQVATAQAARISAGLPG